MGIPGLWDILGEGEVKFLAQLSTDHFRQHKRPLRVAIDEAGWRFHNLSDAQVAAIRQKVPEANPIEKAILWRVLKLMRMNIQPIFIFDGPSRPWKRGGVAGRIDWKKIDLLRKTLNMLKIPHHRAPAEAEAECARLNELGIVDAVWTDDGDALMFGAKVLIKEHREGRGNTAKKSDTLVRIYRADVIEQKHRINRQGLILFALLSGRDYDTKGLPGCGLMAALKAAQFDNGRLGKILCETSLRQLHCFTESLREFFQLPGSPSVYVPPGYPRDLHVKNYREPKVSTPEQAHNLRGLKDGWYVPIDEAKLRPFLLAMFNFDTKTYLKHIVPLLLVKELVQTTPETVEKNLVFELELVHKRGQDHNLECLERQITFNPKNCTELNLWTQPDNEDWAEGFEPTAPVEAEFLEYILVAALGDIEMQRLKQLASQPKPRKRKTTETQAESASTTPTEPADNATKPAAKKQKKAPTAQADTVSSTSTSKAASKRAAKPKPTKRHGKTTSPAEQTEPTESEAPTPPVKKRFQLPRALVRNPSMLSEYASQSSQEVLSRSTSYQSVDLTSETSREVSGVPGNQQDMMPESSAQSKQAPLSNRSDQVPPSSQLDPGARNWASSGPQIGAPSFDEETPLPQPTQAPTTPSIPQSSAIRPQSSQQPPSKRRHVVVDLDSDDEESLPAPAPLAAFLPAPVIAAPVSLAQTSLRPISPATVLPVQDTRQAIAAARLKHFEKKAPETIDLTLDD